MKSVFLFLFIAYSQLILGQSDSLYSISGQIKNVRSGKIYLIGIGSKQTYYLNNRILDSSEIKDGCFKITRVIQDHHPYPFIFHIETDSLEEETGFVFIEPKNQMIYIDSINEYIAPKIRGSATQNELKYQYEPFLKEVALKATKLEAAYENLYLKYNHNIPKEQELLYSTSLQEIKDLSDSLFFEYSKNHRNSYVTLWKLIERFNNNGFKPLYSNIFDLLSEPVKNSVTAQLFKKDLFNAKIFALDNFFPELKLKDSSQSYITLNIQGLHKGYTLIDFWFSECAPCLSQFSKYRDLYNKYTDDKFEIIGISVDEKKDFANWQKVIKEKKMNWKNYLDENGLIAEEFSIHSFPTNFLLDQEGKIIKINITTEQLETFLINEEMKHIYFIDFPNEPD